MNRHALEMRDPPNPSPEFRSQLQALRASIVPQSLNKEQIPPIPREQRNAVLKSIKKDAPRWLETDFGAGTLHIVQLGERHLTFDWIFQDGKRLGFAYNIEPKPRNSSLTLYYPLDQKGVWKIGMQVTTDLANLAGALRILSKEASSIRNFIGGQDPKNTLDYLKLHKHVATQVITPKYMASVDLPEENIQLEERAKEADAVFAYYTTIFAPLFNEIFGGESNLSSRWTGMRGLDFVWYEKNGDPSYRSVNLAFYESTMVIDIITKNALRSPASMSESIADAKGTENLPTHEQTRQALMQLKRKYDRSVIPRRINRQR